MHCPACSGSLREVKMQLVTAEICSQCGGIWFDKHKLKWAANQLAITEKIDPNELRVMFEKRTVEKPDKTEMIRACPKCMLAMKKINYAYDSNIIIDRCGKCGGVWTDKGELKAIAKFVKEDPRVKAIGESLIAKNPAIQEIEGVEKFSHAVALAMQNPFALIAVFALGIVTFVMHRIHNAEDDGNGYNE